MPLKKSQRNKQTKHKKVECDSTLKYSYYNNHLFQKESNFSIVILNIFNENIKISHTHTHKNKNKQTNKQKQTLKT